MDSASWEGPSGEILVRIELGPRSYDIQVVSNQISRFSAFVRQALESSWAGRRCRRVLIVTDENVRPYVPPYADALRSMKIEPHEAVVPPGERSKCLDQARMLLERLVELRANRHMLVMAIGGGVVGDLAGFVAATYARGVPVMMVPTSLLAQVDSSVGGKVGINLPKAKNIVGAFHQPIGVWIDTTTLSTLPIRELRCGLAEVVKYGVILDAGFFTELEHSAEAILALEPAAIRRVVSRCCALKAHVVTRDEREETGLRAVLNFGHTIGHAIESVAGYGGAFQHGEAVAVGMVAESRLAERLGWIDPEITRRLIILLERFGLPTTIRGLDLEAMLDAMTRDKKNEDNTVRFVLPRAMGRVELTSDARRSDVRAVLEDLM